MTFTAETQTYTTSNGDHPGYATAADRRKADHAKAVEASRAEERALDTEIARLQSELAARRDELKAAAKRTAALVKIGEAG